MSSKTNKIKIENVNVPGKFTNVNAAKYKAMEKAFLQIIPKSSPGLTQKQIQLKVKPILPDTLFPKGATSGWWAKTVQLNLEAKGMVIREKCKPLRWYKL